MTDQRQIDRMTGCVRLGKRLLGGTIIIVFGIAFLSFLGDWAMRRPHDGWIHRTRAMLQNLKVSIELFKIEYDVYPTAATNANTDNYLMSRGQLLEELGLSDNARLNFKKIHFIELPIARNQKDGLWQKGDEWVLSDHWSEPYYIILDANEDKTIANP